MIYNDNGLPVPQVLPVSLDTEDEVDQVKHMVIVLTEIRSAPDCYRQTLTEGRLLRTSAALSIRSEGDNQDADTQSAAALCCLSHLCSLEPRQLTAFLSSPRHNIQDKVAVRAGDDHDDPNDDQHHRDDLLGDFHYNGHGGDEDDFHNDTCQLCRFKFPGKLLHFCWTIKG